MGARTPRFHTDCSDDERFSLGRLSAPLIVGFGFHWAWVYLTMLNADGFVAPFPSHEESSSWIFYIVSLATLSACLLGYAVFSKRLRAILCGPPQRKIARALGAVAMCSGTVASSLPLASEQSAWIVVITSAITTGVGSCVLLVSFGISFSQCDIATTVASTALSFLVGIGVYVVVFFLGFVSFAGVLVCAVLPIAECLLLNASSKKLVDKLEFADVTIKVDKAAFAFRLCAPSLFFGFALGLIRTEAITINDIANEPEFQLAGIIFAAMLTAALMTTAMLLQRQHLHFLPRTMTPVVGFALAALCAAQGSSTFLSTLILFTGYLAFEGAMWVTFADISQRYRISAFIVFGFGRGSLALGTLLGAMAVGRMGESMLAQTGPTVLAFACMLAGLATLPNETEIRSTLALESESPLADGTGRDSLPDGHGESQEERSKGRFKRRCEAVANAYLLSKKETEVLFLLAKGRNAAAIQDALYIAEGTARTHMRHIYKKLDVHTQQELIDLVESTELDG